MNGVGWGGGTQFSSPHGSLALRGGSEGGEKGLIVHQREPWRDSSWALPIRDRERARTESPRLLPLIGELKVMPFTEWGSWGGRTEGWGQGWTLEV